MKKHARKLVCAMLAVLFLLGIGASSFAATPKPPISPLWDYIQGAEVEFTFNGTSGQVLGTASKNTSASSIEGVLTLYKDVDGEWEYVDDWSGSKRFGILIVTGNFTAEQGVTYKAEFVVTAYANSVPETDTIEEIVAYS